MSAPTTKAVYLGATNWEEWSAYVQFLLVKEDLLWVIDEVKTKPVNIANAPNAMLPPAAKFRLGKKLDDASWADYVYLWTRANKAAIQTIIAHCDSSRREVVKALVKKTDDLSIDAHASVIWEDLKTKYSHGDEIRYLEILTKLNGLHQKEYASREKAQKHADRVNRLVDQLMLIEVDNEQLRLLYYLYSIQSDPQVRQAAINLATTPDMTLDTSVRSIVSQCGHATTASAATKLLRAGKGDSGRGKRKRDGNTGGSGNGAPKCSHCTKRHKSEECWKKFPHLLPERYRKKDNGDKTEDSGRKRLKGKVQEDTP
ncbi:hypothetical protein BJ508DRAFT_334679 [Ascobolus immersus RN42]|uniref:DUF4219 domain-containing protein n=1 Tax=Ascobolus immersus RN42 TaxID=1160509 RepID=A0A3N4HL14_ASCIM|nr:hypothetical protein BJ508DRAFT_334679 [Ascobolus immersus RN42]